LKLVLGVAGLTATLPMLHAADLTTTYPAYGTNSHVPLNYSGANGTGALSSNSVMVGLNAQAPLLRDMLQEHQRRAAELTQKNQSEKAKWETDLVNELQEKSARIQKNIDQGSQAGSATNDVKVAAGEVDDQLVFVSTVEARLEQLRQELSAARQDSVVLSIQIATNKVPEDIGAMSWASGDNQRLIKDLQKEQLDLELRKLEFRAIRKAMQK